MASESSKVWTIMSLVAGLGAAQITRRVLNTSWKAAAGKEPPENPADPDVGIGEAILWASITGAAIAIARMLAQRRAAHYYARSTGELPPGLRHGDN